MTNERRGPRDYVKEADAEIQGFMEQKRVMESFLSLVREIKRVGDLDVKLETVIQHVTQKCTNPAASWEEKTKAQETMLELKTYVEALENPDDASHIMRDSKFRKEPGEGIALGQNPVQNSPSESAKVVQANVQTLVRSLSGYLNKYIASKGVEK